MDIERINQTLNRAILGLQEGEIEVMAEAAIGGYSIPSPAELGYNSRRWGIGKIDFGPLPKFEVGDKVIEKYYGPGWEIWDVLPYDDYVQDRPYKINHIKSRRKVTVWEKKLSLAPNIPSP